MEQKPGDKTITKEKRIEEGKDGRREEGREGGKKGKKSYTALSTQLTCFDLDLFTNQSQGDTISECPLTPITYLQVLLSVLKPLCALKVSSCHLSAGSAGYTEYPSLSSQTHLGGW